MRISIIGLQYSGKTTFFDILTHHGMSGSLSGKRGSHIGTVFVPDARLDKLSEVYRPKKQVNAAMEFMDTPSLTMDATGNAFASGSLEDVRRADTACLVLRAFDSVTCPHPAGSVDPGRDLRFILNEFMVNDYVMVEKRVEKLRKQVQMTKKPEEQRELEALEKILAALEAERPAREVELTENERKALSPYQLLTAKPILAVLNVGEAQLRNLDAIIADFMTTFPGIVCTALCANTELELAQLEEADAREFMTDLGLKESALTRVLHAAFDMLNLQVFFTAGPDECRAWPIPRGSTAYDAAGAIHTDFQKGFIRASVLPYEAFAKNPVPDVFKSEAQQQRKEYPMVDGDIVEFRFSVSK